MAAAASYGALLDAVRGVHWPARRAVSSLLPGTHHSTLRGTSAEFTEYRLYRQGDDPRRVDWRLLARSDRAYIRLANDRAVLPTTIVLDASASMAFPVTTRDKWRLAQQLTIGLAAVAHADGDPVGVALHDANGKAAILPPRTRRDVVAEIARVALAGDPGGSEPLAPLLRSLRSARLVLITDLLGDEEDALRAVRAHIVGGGEAHVAHIVAREELDPPRRTLLAADPEQAFVQRMLVESTRREYEERFAAWRADVARRWRAAGASYTEVITDEAAPRAVRRVAAAGEQ
ncbi:MAG TPA: DUF58 domain-containing protein [Gemmatimonadaceae bacterium]|jgi:uncharacterized protein (DUF58 family)|nr:DUF58 domain-containing protein [Gemmatimonadaceae bacterium]